jgi:hypothetical protein
MKDFPNEKDSGCKKVTRKMFKKVFLFKKVLNRLGRVFLQAAETASLDLANTENTLFGLENTRNSSKNITNDIC